MTMDGNWGGGRANRRGFLGMGGAAAAALVLGGPTAQGAPAGRGGQRARRPGFGRLVRDPGGVLDLPRGFQYRVLSPEGATLSDGRPVPGDHDGMAAFRGRGDTTVLVRNHELKAGEGPPVVGRNPYDAEEAGGTTAVIVSSNRREVASFVTSSGTRNNCAGGATPWDTWITCEEDRTERHGYCYEVMWDDPENALSKTPITDMGFFSHEAIDIDPRTGIAYLTEDDFRGQIDPDDPANDTRSSFLYRYVPHDRRRRPGALQAGGRLQALAIDDAPKDADFYDPRERFAARWIDVNPAEPHDDALAKGAVRFNRLEGCHFRGGAFWFDDTAGGEKRLGQIFRLREGRGTRGPVLELFYEGTRENRMESPDNLIVTPWGDLWFAEDGDGENRVMGVTPEGQVYKFASNRLNESELAGPCFAPDGRTFFVNIQEPGHTFAISGPFYRAHRGRQRLLAHADPPAHMAPRVSAELHDAADQLGLSPLEAAAYQRLGVPLL